MAVSSDFENVALGVRDARYAQFDIKKVLEGLLLKGSIDVKKPIVTGIATKSSKPPCTKPRSNSSIFRTCASLEKYRGYHP